MSDYADLLDATINHLRSLKEEGIRFVSFDEQTLQQLGQVARAPAGKAAFAEAAGIEASVESGTAAPAPKKLNLQWEEAPEKPATSQYKRPAATARSEASKAASDGAQVAQQAPSLLPPRAPGQKLSPEEKRKQYEDLKARALVCQKCPALAATRRNVVFGVGTIDAELMFVGEAPGWDEDEQGEPFVGKAGQLLTKIIQTMGLGREQVYIANILKCRPDTPGQNFGNRPPTAKEMENCIPYLHAQIDLIQPKLLVALGSTAVNGLFGPVGSITKARGKFREYRGIPTMLTYHPSYLLRPNVNNVKREVWEDMLQVMERLNLPISEKQRGYFSK